LLGGGSLIPYGWMFSCFEDVTSLLEPEQSADIIISPTAGYAESVTIHDEGFGDLDIRISADVDNPDDIIVDIDGAVATLGTDSVLVASLLLSSNLSRITQISSDELTYSTLIQGTSPIITNPQQLAFDSTGRLLWVNCGSPTRVNTVGFFDGTALGVFGTVDVNTCLGGIAIGPDGQVFVSDFENGTVKVLDSDGDLVDPAFVTGLSRPDAMAFDTTGLFGGKLFVVERGNGQIRSIDPVSGNTEVFATDFDSPFGLAFGPDDCLYVSEFNTDTVWKICSTTILVDIDIKPGSYPNSINLGSNGNVPIAILSTETFDATTIDPLTITLAGAGVKVRGNGTTMASVEDVNMDGLLDLVVHVVIEDLELTAGDIEAVLTGLTYGGTPIEGVDTIRIVPST